MHSARLSLFALVSSLAVWTVPGNAHSSALSFQSIYYDKGKIELDAAGRAALERVMGLLKANPKAFLKLEGHATEADADEAMRVSRNRVDIAFGVLMELAQKADVTLERLEAEAFGNTRPVDPAKPRDKLSDRLEFVFADDEALAAAKKKGLETIKVIYWNTLYHSLFQIGVANGTFEAEGFHVQLIATNHSTVDQMHAICGKVPFEQYAESVFAGGVCGGSPHLAASQGVDMVIIGGLLAGGSMIIAKPAMAERLRADPKNFRGIRFGKPVGTGTTTMVLVGWLRQHGIDWSKEITWVNFDSHEDVLEAIADGKVDAGDTYAPLHLRAEKDYGMVTVFNTVQLSPFHPCSRIVTVPSKLKRERPKYVRFMRGVINAHRYFIRNSRQALETVQRFTGYTMDEVRTLQSPAFILNPDPLKSGLMRFWSMLNEAGYISSKADFAKTVDNTVYLDALTSLAEDHKQDPYYQHMLREYRRFNM